MSTAVRWPSGASTFDVARCCCSCRCSISAVQGRTTQWTPLKMRGRVAWRAELSARPRVLHRSLPKLSPYIRIRIVNLPASALRKVTFSPVRCRAQLEDVSPSGGESHDVNSSSPSRGLFQIAALIGSATIVSKFLGLVRETVLAALFGVGPVMDAYSYSAVIPGFCLTLLGGINGPLHAAVTASLSKRSQAEGRHLMQRMTLIIGVVCAAISIAIFLLSSQLIDAIAPGLKVSGCIESFITRDLAVIQLKIMAPCAILAGLTGIGFGALSAAGVYGVPSLSPAASSISVMIAVSIWSRQFQQNIPLAQTVTTGAVYLAVGVTVGALAQWGLQAISQYRAGFRPLQISFGNWRSLFDGEGVQEVFAVLLPASIASGMLQIATYTDLYFASFIPGAAAALGYSNLLAMAPVGILSSAILVPLLPLFSRLSKLSSELELQQRVKQGLLLSMGLTFLMTALVVSLAGPIVRIVFERRAFDASASMLVASLLVYYILGSTFYVARDLLVHAFYALGDGGVPFRISFAAICANAVLDWLLVRYAGLGVQGLVLATCFVNCGSTVALLLKLSSQLQGLKLRFWIRPFFLLASCAATAGIFTKCSYLGLSIRFFTTFGYSWSADILSVILASAVGLAAYVIPIALFDLPEIKSVWNLLQAKL